MAQFSILDCPVCLPSLLLDDTSVMVVSYMIPSMAKVSIWSWPPQVKMHWR
jgi:hypothetical protein